MSRWQVELTEVGEKDFAQLDKLIQSRVLDKLDWLEENFDNIEPLALSGEWGEFFKLRVGDWRVAYTIYYEAKLLRIHYIDHRSKIYKRLK